MPPASYHLGKPRSNTYPLLAQGRNNREMYLPAVPLACSFLFSPATSALFGSTRRPHLPPRKTSQLPVYCLVLSYPLPHPSRFSLYLSTCVYLVTPNQAVAALFLVLISDFFLIYIYLSPHCSFRICAANISRSYIFLSRLVFLLPPLFLFSSFLLFLPGPLPLSLTSFSPKTHLTRIRHLTRTESIYLCLVQDACPWS